MVALKAGVDSNPMSVASTPKVTMQKFAELSSGRAAMLFADYCVAQGLSVHAVVQQPQLAELFCPLAQREQAEEALQLFLQQPGHPRYQAAAWQLSKPSNEQQAMLAPVNWLLVFIQSPVTALVLLITLAVYGWMQFDWRSAAQLLQLNDPAQLWRWFTPMLLHFSLTHLVFNLVWWWTLGRKFERTLGSGMLINVTLSVALLSNAAQYFMAGANFGGLSGVVYGLFGYYWLAGVINPGQRLHISSGMAGFLLLWLVLGFLDVLWVSMANWAHLGGLLAGLCWAWLLRKQQPQ